jgi:type IV pilus assembly protein PilF
MTRARWLPVLLAAVALALAACGSQPRHGSTESPAEINAQLGLRYMQQGDYDVALEKLKRALAENPSLPSAHHYIAELYKNIKNYELAEEHYRKAMALAPNDPAIQNNYGVFLCDRQRYPEAEERFVKAARMKDYQHPDEAYENAGLCALRIPDKGKAEKYFREALNANPLLAPALLEMSALSVDSGEYLQARGFLQRYEAIAPHTAQSLWLGATIEHGLHNPIALADYAKQLREQFPRSEETARLRELE